MGIMMSNFLISWHMFKTEIRKQRGDRQNNITQNPDDSSNKNLLKGYKDKKSKKNNGNNNDKNS